MLKKLKIIWEWVKGACIIIVLLMILSGIISGMYFGEYDKGVFYLAMYYQMCRKAPAFRHGDIRHVHRICASNLSEGERLFFA